MSAPVEAQKLEQQQEQEVRSEGSLGRLRGRQVKVQEKEEGWHFPGVWKCIVMGLAIFGSFTAGTVYGQHQAETSHAAYIHDQRCKATVHELCSWAHRRGIDTYSMEKLDINDKLLARFVHLNMCSLENKKYTKYDYAFCRDVGPGF